MLARYGFPVEERLLANYRNWDYCVQYQESDFAFVSSLMEQEGIYYYFRHEAAQQVLVLADDISAHDPLPVTPRCPTCRPIVWPCLATKVSTSGIRRRRSAQAPIPSTTTISANRRPTCPRCAHPLSAEHGGYGKYLWQGGYIEAEQGEHYAARAARRRAG